MQRWYITTIFCEADTSQGLHIPGTYIHTDNPSAAILIIFCEQHKSRLARKGDRSATVRLARTKHTKNARDGAGAW